MLELVELVEFWAEATTAKAAIEKRLEYMPRLYIYYNKEGIDGEVRITEEDKPRAE